MTLLLTPINVHRGAHSITMVSHSGYSIAIITDYTHIIIGNGCSIIYGNKPERMGFDGCACHLAPPSTIIISSTLSQETSLPLIRNVA